MAIWTVLISISGFWNLGNSHDQAVSLATSEARSTWDKDQAFRNWASRHGGVYVTPDDRTPPNPYLKFLPNRDIETKDGQTLTLMNPAYMLRQMTEEFEEQYGIKGRITGKILLNPVNKADAWELAALDRLEMGEDEVLEVSTIGSQNYVRLMRPMYMKKGCEKCHGHLGFREGDIRGGVSVSVPLNKYLAVENDSRTSLLTTHGGIWILGIAVIGFISLRGKRSEEEQQKAAQILYETEERYKTLFENSEISIWDEDFTEVVNVLNQLRQQGITDLRRYLLDNQKHTLEMASMVKVNHVNTASLRSFGAIGESEFLSHIDKSMGPGSIAIWIDELCAIWNKEKYFRSEASFQKLDGTQLEAIISFRIPDTEKGFQNVPVSIIDITDRKLAEARIQKSEERFRSLYNQSPLGITVEDYSGVKIIIDGLRKQGVTNFNAYFRSHPEAMDEAVAKIRLTAANDTLMAMYGAATFEEYKKYNDFNDEYFSPEWLNFYIDEFSTFAHGGTTFGMEVSENRMDGSSFELNCISRLVKSDKDDWSEVISTHEDVTARKHFEDHARRAQKMEAVGQLSGGIAHDFNNILGVVMGNLDIIERLTGENEKIQGRIETARRGAKRGAELTRKLLGFSRKEAERSVLTSVNETIENLDELLSKSLTIEIPIQYNLQKNLWPVKVDPGDLQDAILNMALNARDAMPEGGHLLI